MGKRLNWIEFVCSVFIAIFSMFLGILTVVTVLKDLTEKLGMTVVVSLLIYIFALGITFVFDAWRKWPPRKSKAPAISQPPKSFSRIVIGVIILMVLIEIILSIFSFSKTYGWEDLTTFTALGAAGAWVTGVALAVFAYLQWRVHQQQHNLLYTPKIQLSSGGTPATGPSSYGDTYYPYRVEWTALLHNSSQMPIFIFRLDVEIRFSGEESGKRTAIPPFCCHVLEPKNIQYPLQVTLAEPVRVKWIIEGTGASDLFEYMSNDINKRNFQLVCRISYATRLDQPALPAEVVSEDFYVPLQAAWGVASFHPFIV